MANQQSETFELPVGVAVYPRLQTPDTKFDELGQYKADVAMSLEDAQPMMERLQKIHKSHTGKAAPKTANTMWLMELDEEGEETGRVVFKVRVKNRMTKAGKLWDRRPVLFDALAQKVDVNPYGGSTMIVTGEIYCWDAGGKKGVSLQPQAVQILKMVAGSGGAAADFGFKARDGYEGLAADPAPKEDQQSSGEEDGDTPEDGDY